MAAVAHGWQTHKRARLEHRPEYGTIIVGWEHKRDCGCYAIEAMRLDKMEPVFGAGACAEHGPHADRAMAVFGHMEPCDRQVGELWRELLEREIGDTL